ncbi:uncharacterized protein N7506_006323 [Penicillium brevicompactum]|uniref:uncharacterized protein n=1 Tax=Penicillium brevicompactum TaxID=5074 RepID=UPI00253FA488|nr:uncharacterized protein N7506_006323 [Penicillium brevicompactum]KAJ5332540.1 hypothetical protein N7506_006323 [Penicillium brevicompactum]
MDRKRAARACDECRRLKEKWLAPRNREFRQYIPKEREKSVRSDFRELIQRSKYMERILKQTIEGIALDTKNLARLADALEADNGDRTTVIPEAKDGEAQHIDDEACTMVPVGDTTTHFSGEFSYWNFSMRVKNHIESQIQEPGNHDPDPASNFPRARQLRSGNHLSTAISSCPPRHIAGFLVKTFFKYAETHYFFIEEAWLHERLDLLYNDPHNFTNKGNEVTICILLTIFAIGTQYAHLESLGQDSDRGSRSTFSEDDVGAAFYQQAIRLLPEIIEISSLESVQACLLFGYYALPVDASGLGFIYINLAMRLGMQNGMHRKCKNEAFSRTMIETRNRVWWTAYVLERKISIFHGRPLSVMRSDVDANTPLYQGLNPEDYPGNITRCCISVQLVQFLEDFFHEINILRNCHKNEASKIISRLVTRKVTLTNWWNSLSKDAVDGDSQGKHVRSIMHLRLEYCLVRMFVGRQFLLKQDTPTSNTSSPANADLVDDGNSRITDGAQKSGREDLIDDCIQAATEALEICQQVRDSGIGLARASYIEYSSCRASLLVLIAYSIQNFSERFRKALCGGLDMIREMSAAGESARSEVSLIESLERALARLHTGLQSSHPGSAQSLPISDYEAFKNWGSHLTERNADSSQLPADLRSGQHDDATFPSRQQASFASENNGPGNSNMDILDAFDPLVEMSIFGAENVSPSAAWPTYTEAQVLEHFITNPQYVTHQET